MLTTLEVGQATEGIPDEDVLEFAAARGRVVLTQNRRDFIRLHHRRQDHGGLIVCTANPDFSALAAKIDAALHSLTSLKGQLLRVNHGD